MNYISFVVMFVLYRLRLQRERPPCLIAPQLPPSPPSLSLSLSLSLSIYIYIYIYIYMHISNQTMWPSELIPEVFGEFGEWIVFIIERGSIEFSFVDF